MVRDFLRYAAGGPSGGGEAAMDAETVGGINAGLSVLAVAAALILCRYADLGPAIAWICALAAGMLQFFAYRLIMTSVHSKRGEASGRLTLSALLQLMPEIVTIALTSWVLSTALFIGFVGKEVEAQAALRQAALASRQVPAEPQGATTDTKRVQVGLLERYTIAQQLSPATGSIITTLLMLVAMLPVVVGRRSSAS